MKILIAPDSFKGSLSASDAAGAMASGVLRAVPDAEVRLLPMADGGEDTLDAVLSAMPGECRRAMVTDAEGYPLAAEYAVLQEGTAVIEVARIVGLALLRNAPKGVGQRSTLGVGEMLRQCLDAGIRRFLIGLGSSSTSDGGAGLLTALGAVLRDRARRHVWWRSMPVQPACLRH